MYTYDGLISLKRIIIDYVSFISIDVEEEGNNRDCCVEKDRARLYAVNLHERKDKKKKYI